MQKDTCLSDFVQESPEPIIPPPSPVDEGVTIGGSVIDEVKPFGAPPGCVGEGEWVQEGRKRFWRQRKPTGAIYIYNEKGELMRVRTGLKWGAVGEAREKAVERDD